MRVISGIWRETPVKQTMPQATISTTKVRIAVAKLELTPSMPILAKIEVKAAKKAEKNANTAHITIFYHFVPKDTQYNNPNVFAGR